MHERKDEMSWFISKDTFLNGSVDLLFSSRIFILTQRIGLGHLCEP